MACPTVFSAFMHVPAHGRTCSGRVKDSYALGLPQPAQNFPVFPSSPQDGQVQGPLSAAGLAVPQPGQNLPLFPAWPQLGQVHSSGSAGFAVPQFEQNFPPLPVCPQDGQVHPAAAADGACI